MGQQCVDAPRPAMSEIWPPGKLEVLLVRARHRVHQRLHAGGRRDIVLLRAHREHRAGDGRELDRPAAHHELALDELVLLVELLHPLAEELAGERQVLVRPLVEGVEARDVLRIPQVPPQVHVGAEVHRRLEELEAELDHVGGDGAERVHVLVDVEVARVEPLAEHPHLGEVDGPRHVDVVLEGKLRMRGRESTPTAARPCSSRAPTSPTPRTTRAPSGRAAAGSSSPRPPP